MMVRRKTWRPASPLSCPKKDWKDIRKQSSLRLTQTREVVLLCTYLYPRAVAVQNRCAISLLILLDMAVQQNPMNILETRKILSKAWPSVSLAQDIFMRSLLEFLPLSRSFTTRNEKISLWAWDPSHAGCLAMVYHRTYLSLHSCWHPL